jgi:hypothetical protein
MLLGPSYYEIRNLSDKLKDEVKEKVALHCDWLREKNARPDIIESFNSIISYISNDASTDDIAKFVQETRKIDERRGQSFPDTFPEYSQWWEEIDNSLIRVNSI